MIDPTELDRVSLDGPDEWGNSPLSMALVAERFDEAARLLAAGASRDRFDALGQGLWHFAAGYRKKAYLDLSLSWPSDPNLARKDGACPLHVAASTGNEAAVRALLGIGANPCVRDARGDLPLAVAVARGEGVLVRLLAEAMPPEGCCGDGNTEMHYAAASGNAAYLAYLVARGISVDVANSRGETPLMIAVLYERAQSVKYLLSRGANPDRKNAKGISVREIARARRSAAINRMLAEALR
ncbi:MAG TPA: ankyrin repeat domain-containing protein [Treponemataceae bacterium]|nr:ankyrin repeat domain-containing protein [Treponemataceae bacterium]